MSVDDASPTGPSADAPARELPPLAWIAVGAGVMLLFFLALMPFWMMGVGGPMDGWPSWGPWGMGFGAGVFGLFGLLGLAVFVLAIVVTVQAYRAGRTGWWVYLICVFFSPLNLVAVVAWFVHLKDHPWKWGDSLTV